MRILCTGGLGFLGSHVAEVYARNGDTVDIVDNMSRGEFNERIKAELMGGSFKANIQYYKEDIRNQKKMKELIVDNYDRIFHFAALPSHRNALERPHEYIEIDCMGTANILEAARLSVKKPLVVFASSNKVYGKQECPWREDKLPQPEGPYAVAKWASEKLCEMYNQYYNVPCLVLRYHHVAGARSNPELALSVFTEQALAGKALEVHGTIIDGPFIPCSADYTHVDDAIAATVMAVEKYKGFEIFNIANKKLTSVLTLAFLVTKALHSVSQVRQAPLLPHETLEHHSDVSKVERELGFVAKIPVERAVVDYIHWRKKYE